MLRSLYVDQFARADDGNVIVDDKGQPVPLEGAVAGQPKSREHMSSGELDYVDRKWPAVERETRRTRYQQRLKEDAMDRAAEADLKARGEAGTK